MDEEVNGGNISVEASVSSITAITEEDLSSPSLNATPATFNLAKKPTTSLNGGATQDMRSWNKVLLQWINECNFIECNYFYIEQSDIESFYKEFRKRLNNGTTKDTENHRKRLKTFIEDQYPDFVLHLDDENELSSADYIYVYSLLLHYCCIKCADEYFHNICKQLSNTTQSAIASFFNILVESEVLDRDCLRHAIAAVVEASPTTPKDKDDNSSVSYSSMPPPNFSNSETSSPLKTPKRGQNQLQRVSPNTPKTFLLEERTRELFNLRAQLETERYDKGVLEVQIRQYEETILNMKQDQRKLSTEMQELKSQLLAKQMDGFGDSEKTDSDDMQYKRRLHKQISDKEEQLAQLTVNVSTLEEDKTMLQQKLKFAQNQVIICMDRVNELDCRVEELNQQLEQKDQTINSLVNTKAELEQHIAEARAAARHIDLNTSVECMDSSFARTTNSSSLGSPENLGVSVIDVQLRETEKENQQLRERLDAMQLKNNALIASMHSELAKHWGHYKVEDHNLVYAGEELVEKEELNDEFEMFKVFVDKLSQAYGAEKESTRKLQTDNELLQQTTETLNTKLKVLEEELEQLKERAEAVALTNHRLDSEKSELANQLLSMEKEMQLLKEQSSQINAQLSEVNEDYQKYTQRTKQEIKQMQAELMESHLQLTQSTEQHNQLKASHDEVLQKFVALDLKHSQAVKMYEDRIAYLEGDQSTLQEKLQQSRNVETQLNKKNEQLLIKMDEMQASALQTDEHLSSMNKLLENEQQRAKEMGEEIQLIVEKNKKLEERIIELQIKQEKDDQQYKAKLQELTEQESELRLLYDQTSKELKIKESDYNNAKEKMQNQFAYVEALATLLNDSDSSSNSSENFSAITTKVRQLMEQTKVHETVIQQLELACDEKSRKITVLEAQCSEAYTIKQQLQAELEKIDALTTKCGKYESELSEMREQQAKDIAELKEGMADKAKHYQELIQLKELKHEESSKSYQQTIKDLEGTIKSTAEERDKQVHTLESALKNLEIITGQQIEQLQKQLESTCSENSAKLEQLQKLQIEHAELELQYQQAREHVKELKAQLKTETESKQQISEQLELTAKELDDNNYELEQKLNDVQQLKKQLEVEKTLAAALDQSTNQLQAQVEQSHKREADLFKKIEMYKEQEEHLQQFVELAEKLKKEVLDLQAAKEALAEQHTALEADLVTKEAELRIAQEETFQLRGKFKTITAKLTEAMAELESKDFAIEDILGVLENNYNLKSPIDEVDALSLSSGDMPNYFNVSSEDDHDHFTQLKCALNRLMQNYRRIELQLQNEQEKQLELELISSKSMTTLRNDHLLELQHKNAEVKELQEQLDCKAAIIKDLQEQLAHELEVKESKLRNELKQLFNERANLENVNKKLSTENSQMQEKLSEIEAEVQQLNSNINELKGDKDKLNEELKANAEKLKKQEQKARDSQKEQSKVTDTMRKQLEIEFDKLKAQLTEAEKHKSSTQTKLKQLEHKQQTMQQKHKDLQAELEKQQKANETLEAKLEQKCKAFVSLESAKAELARKLQQLQDQLTSQSKELETVVSDKLSLESKFAELQSEQQQNVRELEVLRVQRQTTLADIERLTANIDCCNGEKLKLHNNLNDVSRELQRANDNLSQLIQEIASIRREKEGFINENQLLTKQLNEINKIHETSESQLKEKLQNAQSLERQMLANENELKSLRDLLDKHMKSEEKLSSDNAKLRESSESQTKRIERYALQLGEAQARHAKLERENDKISTSLQAANAVVEELKREKEVLQGELRILKEKFTRLERTNEQLSVKLKSLESANTALRDANIKLEHNDMESVNKIKRLEKQRQQHEEKLRNLNNSLAASEATGTRLNLEIGALNSQLQELRKTIKGEYAEELQSLERRLKSTEKQVEDYEELCEKLKVERQQNHEQIAELTDKQEKVTLALEIEREKCNDVNQQLEQIRGELLIKREEHSQAVQELQSTVERFESYKAMQEQFLTEKCKELQLAQEEKNAVEINLAAALEKDRALSGELAKVERERGGSDEEVQELRSRIKTIVDEMAKEQEITAQLRLDNQILQAKYREAKQQLIDESKASEQRLKENRLELEGKLEKMKSKMKNLYTEEVAKMKTKHDRELVSYKEDKALLTAQNTKYEEHNRKLSSQIVRLNERVLELKTENTILNTKVKHLEEKENCSINSIQQKASFKRPTSLHVTSTTTSSVSGNHHHHQAGSGGSANIGTNLAMEDEEGEVFNNTYLTDLKNGRMSELMSRDVCAEELKYRNSLLPPHLKSTYAAQYFDQNLGEDDIKDGPHSLDDSMSALLSTTSGGTRKKCSGVTHYKRPGPPTPSKNGGRLSFGSSEPPREILKETFDTNVSSSSSAKTPARFGFFASRFSMGTSHVKEEQLDLPQSVATTKDLRRFLQMRQLQSASSGGGVAGGLVICTSTPRKSRAHELCRNLEQPRTSTPKPIRIASPVLAPKCRRLGRKSRIFYLQDENVQLTPLTTLPAMLIKAPIALLPAAHTQKSAGSIKRAAGQRQRCNSCHRVQGSGTPSKSTSQLMKRYLRRLRHHVAYSPATDDTGTTNSPASSIASLPTTCRCESLEAAATTPSNTYSTPPSTGDFLLKLERQLRRKRKTRSTARVSLNVRGNMFARQQQRRVSVGGASVALKDLNVAMRFYTKRKQRNDNFYRNRAIPTDLSLTTTTDLNSGTVDATFDLTNNNNYSTINHNKNKQLNETMVIEKSEDLTLPVVISSCEQTQLTEELEEDELEEDEVEADEVEGEVEEKDIKEILPSTEELQQQLQTDTIGVGSIQAEESFGKFEMMPSSCPQIKEDFVREELGSSQHFEHLLAVTESQAPFELNLNKFENSKELSAIPVPTTSTCSQNHSSSSTSVASSTASTTNEFNHMILTCSTVIRSSQQQPQQQSQFHQSSTVSGHLSRTIYGGSVIINRRLPHINSTCVRKSSIYIKNQDRTAAGEDDIILVTNQTITLVDLMRMWSQMNVTTRCIIAFIVLAFLMSLFTTYMNVVHGGS